MPGRILMHCLVLMASIGLVNVWPAGLAGASQAHTEDSQSPQVDAQTEQPTVNKTERMRRPIDEELQFWEKLRTMWLDLFVVLYTLALGATIGSFLNVVIYRMPRGMNIARPGSSCPKCKTPIAARDNIPLCSWLLLRGRCRHCRAPIAARYFWVELTVGLMFVLLLAAEVFSGGRNLPFREPEIYRDFTLFQWTSIWELSRIALFHACFAVIVLACTLIEYDGLRTPRRLLGCAVAIGLIAPLIWPDLRPVPARISAATDTGDSSSSEALVTGIVGLLVGAALGRLLAMGLSAVAPSSNRENLPREARCGGCDDSRSERRLEMGDGQAAPCANIQTHTQDTAASSRIQTTPDDEFPAECSDDSSAGLSTASSLDVELHQGPVDTSAAEPVDVRPAEEADHPEASILNRTATVDPFHPSKLPPEPRLSLIAILAAAGAFLGWQAALSAAVLAALAMLLQAITACAVPLVGRFPPIAWVGIAFVAQVVAWRPLMEFSGWPGTASSMIVGGGVLLILVSRGLAAGIARLRTPQKCASE